jgi:hypothetical protein
MPQMFCFKISGDAKWRYSNAWEDAFTCAAVVAASEEDARKMHPSGDEKRNWTEEAYQIAKKLVDEKSDEQRRLEIFQIENGCRGGPRVKPYSRESKRREELTKELRHERDLIHRCWLYGAWDWVTSPDDVTVELVCPAHEWHTEPCVIWSKKEAIDYVLTKQYADEVEIEYVEFIKVFD